MASENAFAFLHGASHSEPAQDTNTLRVTRSFSGRAWRFRNHSADVARALEAKGISNALARMLASRGVTEADAELFLAPTLKSLLPDPYVLANMEKAARRLARAIVAGERVAVLADYDVDGACSASLVLRFLKAQGREGILHVPDRMKEGYGPSVAAMRKFHEAGAKVVVTVDCGAGAHAALDEAGKLGLDVIVLDHHAVETHPPAFAHVNPNAPGDESGLAYICGAGVTFLALVATQRVLREEGWFSARAEHDLLAMLDVVGLATITDVVPLKGVNRAFVRQGLKVLERLSNAGLAALTRVAAVEAPFTPHHLGFALGPRINAGGRVGRCDLGTLLLICDDAAQADILAAELNTHNRERQAVEASILERALEMAAAQSESSFLLMAGDFWHAGVVGIVAGRLRERYAKPALVAGFETDGADEIARGSARSVPGVDLGAVIRAAREAGLLESGGGHAMAAGFSVTRAKLPAFRAFLSAQLESQRGAIALASELETDALLSASGATLAFLDEMEKAGPFGAGNPEPVFVFPDMRIVYAGVVGTNHVKLRLATAGGAGLDGIAFRAADTELGQALLKGRGRIIHVAGKLKRDTYNGGMRVQIHVEDAAPAGV